jgi:hypothetical protein
MSSDDDEEEADGTSESEKIFTCEYCGREIRFQETEQITGHLVSEHGGVIRGNYSTPSSPFEFRRCQRKGCEGKVQQNAYCDERAHDNLRVIAGWGVQYGAYGSVIEN